MNSFSHPMKGISYSTALESRLSSASPGTWFSLPADMEPRVDALEDPHDRTRYWEIFSGTD